jgi:hypothetical protein
VKQVLFTLSVLSLAATGACDSSDEPSDTWTSPTEGILYEGDYPECVRYCWASVNCVSWDLEDCYANCDSMVSSVPECEELALESIRCSAIVYEYQCGSFSECFEEVTKAQLCQMGPIGWEDENGCNFWELKRGLLHTTLCQPTLGPDGRPTGAACECTNEQQTVTCTQPTMACGNGESCCATALP